MNCKEWIIEKLEIMDERRIRLVYRYIRALLGMDRK